MKRRYVQECGKPIRAFKPGERIEVWTHKDASGYKWHKATVVGYETSSGKRKEFRAEPFPNCLLHVKIDGDRHAWSLGYGPTTTNFRELLQESLL